MDDAAERSGAASLPAQLQLLRSSSTNVRVDVLGKLLREIQDDGAVNPEQPQPPGPALTRLGNEHETTNIVDVLPALLATYPLYADRKSRRGVQECLRAILNKAPSPEPTFAICTKFLLRESQKPVQAATNAFVLLEWCCLVQRESTHHRPCFETSYGPLCLAAARLLDKCEDEAIRQGIRRAALATARNGLYGILQTVEWGEAALNLAIEEVAAGADAQAGHAPYLGLLASVSASIPPRTDQMKQSSRRILDFYVKHVIGAKKALPPHESGGLRDFFLTFVTLEEVEEIVAPAIEKTVLRSPEFILDGILDALAFCLPREMDVSKLVLTKLCKPLLSALNSTNSTIRDGAGKALLTWAGRGGDKSNLRKVSDELIKALKASKSTNFESRAILADVLGVVTPDLATSPAISQSIILSASKEPNEGALRKELGALANHLVLLVSQSPIEKPLSDAIFKACSDKRPAFRKAWILCIADVLKNLGSPPEDVVSQDFVRTSLQILKTAYDEIAPNPLPPAQNGSVAAALCLPGLLNSTALAAEFDQIIPRDQLRELLLAADPKLSFLLNPRVYMRLQSTEECRWLLFALTNLANDLVRASDEYRTLWGRAMLHLLLSPEVDTNIREDSGHTLFQAYTANPAAVGSSVILGIWDALRSRAVELSTSKGGEPIPLSDNRLRQAIKCVTMTKNQARHSDIVIPVDVVEQQLVSAVVLLRPELIVKSNWITTCLACGLDPGMLVEKHKVSLMKEVLSHFDETRLGPLSPFEIAACNAAADLAFVAPNVFTADLVRQFDTALNVSQWEDISPEDAFIARAPEGTLVVDVLAQEPNGRPRDKNQKDYDVLLWEEQIRSRVTDKKVAGPRKLTADQQAKVDAQLVREASTRVKVRSISTKVRRGAQFIQSLAYGPPTDARLWLPAAIEALLNALQSGASHIIDGELVSAYLACSRCFSDRLGVLRYFIGAATLRALQAADVPSELSSEPLSDLGTRVLYRLRFTAEHRPFDTVSTIYALPLVLFVLEKGGLDQVSQEDADAQVLLALEFLSFQVDLGADEQLPRAKILHHLIVAMQRYTQHYRVIKDCLFDLCRAISANITSEERDLLLSAVTLPQAQVRSAVLQIIQSELDLSEMENSVHIWIACHDDEDENAETALAIWEEHDFQVTNEMLNRIPPFLFSHSESTRVSAAKALAQALLQLGSSSKAILNQLEDSYRAEIQSAVPKMNTLGILQKGDSVDQWEKRSGLALAFKQLSSVLDQDSIVPSVTFLVSSGAITDRNARVRSEMVDAGITTVTDRGQEKLEELMQLLEAELQGPDKGTQEGDWAHEAVIVLYGSLARHLPARDKRTQSVLQKLLDALSIPSESVQFAVANCLSSLVRPPTVEVGDYMASLLENLFRSKTYAARRGAAYGLAGMIKGRGLGALRQYRVMSTLRSAAENKKVIEERQGAVMAYELLSLLLERTFEPYVIDILPQLLVCFGDPAAAVRQSCLDTAKTCFSYLSSFGVSRVLPQLLEGLDETQWRSKKGACDLLGAMAYLDPQQLATSLPDIIPPLTSALTDSHKEVRAAANNSLKRFGEVITNPEVRSLVDILLKALSDPTKYTEDALDGLIKVSFVHYLDAPSLALVVRILERGLNDRSGTRRKAAQIIGSLANLTEKRDIVTHLPILVHGLRLASVDPVPATRATGSKALGSLVEKLGEDAFPDLIPALMSSLRSEEGASDRLGSAQALSEVLAGLGTIRLEETLPTILQNVSSSRATVREGFMTLFIFLPACFGNSFANYLAQVIPSILGGLADEIEAIRETALRAGRLIVKNFASKAIDLLLPELQRGLADDSHRIRLSSVELVGDLLFNLTGIHAQPDVEVESEAVSHAGQSLLEVLGEETRNKVLSSLYICRCDTSGHVRAAAITVWKALVSTPRTLREIAPTLTEMIIERLASSSMEHKEIAGNALGEVIRKAGEGVFASLLPSLKEGLETSTDSEKRQGICIALREIVNAASPEALEEHEKDLVAIIRLALTDADADVREAAAESFDALQRTFGRRVVDQVLPHLLTQLRNDADAEHALSALLTLLTDATRANAILPNLIPTLLTTPITAFNARALGSLARVGGPGMTRRLPTVINSLVDSIVTSRDEDLLHELHAAVDAVLASIDEFDGLNTAMSVVLNLVRNDDHDKRAVAASHLASFFATTTVDYSRYNQDLIRVLLISFGDREEAVVKAMWSALSQLQAHLKKEEMESLVVSTRQALRQAGTAGSVLHGFSLPKGILPVLQIFLQGLMNGTTDQRVQSALGISEIIERCNPDALKPFVTQITGPLIRVVGERSMDVKCAILSTLNQLLETIPSLLRPFLPQLQRTFTKSLSEPSSELLRSRATKALSTLITLTPRVDPLIAELVAGAKTSEVGVRNSMLKALQEVISRVGSNMSDTSRNAILSLMDSQDSTQDDAMIETNALLMGTMIKALPADKADLLIKGRVLLQPPTPSSILALNAVLLESASSLLKEHDGETRGVIAASMAGQPPFVQQNGILALGKYLLTDSNTAEESTCGPLLETLASVMAPGGDIDSRRLAFVVIRTVVRLRGDDMRRYLSTLVPSVFAAVRDPIIPIKLAAEAAFVQIFSVVDEESALFDAYLAGPGKSLLPAQARSMSDYFRRVALRLGGQARERREAEGGFGGLGLSSDEQEDERELWSVGRVNLGESGQLE